MVNVSVRRLFSILGKNLQGQRFVTAGRKTVLLSFLKPEMFLG